MNRQKNVREYFLMNREVVNYVGTGGFTPFESNILNSRTHFAISQNILRFIILAIVNINYVFSLAVLDGHACLIHCTNKIV